MDLQNIYIRPDGCVMGMNTKFPPTDVNMSPEKNPAFLSIESWLFNKDPYVMVDEIIPKFLGSIIACMIKQPVKYPKWQLFSLHTITHNPLYPSFHHHGSET